MKLATPRRAAIVWFEDVRGSFRLRGRVEGTVDATARSHTGLLRA